MGDSLIPLLLSFFSLFSFYNFTEKQMKKKKESGEKGAKEVVSLARQFARSVMIFEVLFRCYFFLLLFALCDFVSDVRVEFVVHLYEGSQMVLINLESFLFQIRGSCNAGGHIGLNVLKLHEQ